MEFTMNKQVICEIDGQYFGFDSMSIVSIESIKAQMLLVNAPDFCEGIVKFRGEWIPIVTVRKLLNLHRKPFDEDGQVLFLRSALGTVGYRVDKVVEIDMIDDNELQKIPAVITSGKTAYLTGACSHHGRLMVIVNHDRLMSSIDILRIREGLKAVYAAEEAEKRREEEEARRKAEEEEAKKAGKEVKPEVKPEVKKEVKPEVKPEVKTGAKPEVKPEVKPEAKPEAKPVVKPEVKPEVKSEIKPEPKQEAKKPNKTGKKKNK